MDYFTNYNITSPDFFAGMREAIIKYAWWKDGEQYVGCGVYNLKKALAEVDRLEKEAKLEVPRHMEIGPNGSQRCYSCDAWIFSYPCTHCGHTPFKKE